MTYDPPILTERDDEILGVANSIDGMGVLAVWGTRARDVIPHLTAQTTNARGFMVLLEALRLIEELATDEPELSQRTADAFIIVEQVFARIVGENEGDWPLPGARRVRGRVGQPAHASLVDRSWHLLGSQRANGLWGLYRGAASRAELLDASLERLSDTAMAAVEAAPVITSEAARDDLRGIILGALAGDSPEVLTSDQPLVGEIRAAWAALPTAALLQQAFIKTTDLTDTLARVLLQADGDDVRHRDALSRVGEVLPSEQVVLDDLLRCEDLLSVLESLFFHACAAAGDRRSIADLCADLQLDMAAIESARRAFASSGSYDGIAATRARKYVEDIDTSSPELLIRSVVDVHEGVAKGRGRAVWVWVDELGRLATDVDVSAPDAGMVTPGIAWRNDYFLSSLRSVAAEVEEALS